MQKMGSNIGGGVTQSCPTLCNPIDCSPPGSSIHGIFQARVLEWAAISFSRESSRPRDWTRVSRIVDRHFTVWATREVPGSNIRKEINIIILKAEFTISILRIFKITIIKEITNEMRCPLVLFPLFFSVKTYEIYLDLRSTQKEWLKWEINLSWEKKV